MTALEVTSGQVTAVRRPGGAKRAIRTVAIVVGIVAACLWLSTALHGPSDPTEQSPDNPGPDGARALAQVLRAQGVSIVKTDSVARALRQDSRQATILVIDPFQRSEQDLSDLAAASADLVLVGDMYESLPALTYNVLESTTFASDTPGAVQADCDNPEARRAGSVTRPTTLLLGNGKPPDGVKTALCFGALSDSYGSSTTGYGYAAVSGQHTVRVFGERTVLLNGVPGDERTDAGLLADGNASLVLSALGAHPTLVWLLPPERDGEAESSAWDVLPPWMAPALAVLAFAGVLAAVWRGRRFGALVPEPLPVEVRAAETAYGRGRLYRSARAYGHAAAALRAGAAGRIGARLGLLRSSGPQEVVAACAQASGWPPGEIHELLYGAAPASGAALTDLARRLDQLESEVNRP